MRAAPSPPRRVAARACLAAAVLLAAVGVPARAEAPPVTPVGLWRTIDDATGREKSLVRIAADAAGTLAGRVEKVLDPARVDALCVKCEGERRDRPVAGMTVLEGVHRAGGDEAVWEGGRILDPENGRTYRVRLRPVDDGRRLEVRGYLGPFHRTQVWQRVE